MSVRNLFLFNSTFKPNNVWALLRPASKGFSRYLATKADINVSRLVIEKTKTPKPLVPNKELVFGRTFTDHMLQIEWNAEKGWDVPKIVPYSNLSLGPSALVFHYAIECFEGMKAYKDAQGKVRLFRVDKNMTRFNNSANRLTLPTFNEEQLSECIKRLVATESRWVPAEKGYSLYLRPTMIATQESLGVGPTNKALLFVICCPVGPYYPTGFSAVKLLATTKYSRAWPGGTGAAKVGGNYAPTIEPQVSAAKEGYQQVLWLFGKEKEITEVGTMNAFVFLKNEKGEKELVTPPLDGTILPGVTRDSILALAREWKEFKVSERKITMAELKKANKEKRLIEMFGAGTACIVSPIKQICDDGELIDIPLDPKNPSSQAGPLTERLMQTLLSIQYGEILHKWSTLV